MKVFTYSEARQNLAKLLELTQTETAPVSVAATARFSR